MKKALKRSLSLLLAITIIMGSAYVGLSEVDFGGGFGVTASAKTNHTKDEAVAWIKARGNEKWCVNFDNDIYGCQCADLIMAYYTYLVGYHVSGNAKDYLSTSKLPSGWYIDSTPTPGSIIVWGGNTWTGQWKTGENGHIGLVYEVSGNNVSTVETNIDGSGTSPGAAAKFCSRVNVGAKYIHPDFNGTPTVSLKTPTITFNKSSYTVGDTITLSWPASPSNSNLSHYWVRVTDSSGNVYVNNRVDKSTTSYSFTTPGVGTFQVITSATPIGSVSGEGSLTDTKSITINANNSTYTITYNANGGTGAPSAQTKYHDSALAISTTKPTRSGYTFVGWSASSTATSATYLAGSPYTANSSVTLYAVWVINGCTVSYDANGGTGAPGSSSHYSGSIHTISSTIPERLGYTFKGWGTSSNASITYSPGQNYTVTSNITFYAQWEGANLASLESTYTAKISNAGYYVYYELRSYETMEYVFESTGTVDSKITLYDINGTELATNDNGGSGRNFYLNYTLKGGQIYYIKVYACGDNTGSIPFTVKGMYLEYEMVGNGIKITACKKTVEGEFVIPSEIDGYPVTSIGFQAFYGCKSLTSIVIPDSVTSIGSSAFSGCTSLASVTIGDSVTSISSDAFGNCTSLESVTIGNGVTSIGDGAFKNCTSLTSITIPDSVTSIDVETFSGCISLTSLTIPDSVISIGEKAFYKCTSLTSIIIPDSVTSIGNYAFYECTSLTSITIPDSVTGIGSVFNNTAYYNNSSNWQNGVLYIGNHLIKAEATLSGSYTIKTGTKTIAAGAFQDCTSLTSITIPDSVTSIGSGAFYNTVYYNDSSYWENGVLYIGNHLIKAKTTLSGDYEIKYGTKTVATNAFYDCTSLTSITIPDSVISIGNEAFRYCTSIASISLGNGVTSIGRLAFYKCSSLTSITIPNSVTRIDYSVFSNCTSLTSITIPDSVTSIGYKAFSGCTSLKNVYYSGTEADWKNISIDLDNDNLTNSTIHYHVHSCGDWIIYIEPTCTEHGEKRRCCSGCDYYESSGINPTGHLNTVWITEHEPTCTEDGYNDEWCLDCGEIINTETISSTGHYKGEWTIDLLPTCTEDGSMHSTCSVCNEVVSMTMVSLGHSHSTEWTVDIAPTCTSEGSKSHHCTVCGDKADVTVIEPTGHTYSDEWTIDVAPTCTEEGSKSHRCIACYNDVADVTVIEALGHNYKLVSVAEEHPHTNTFKCSRCTETKTEASFSDKCGVCNFSYTDVDSATCRITGYIGGKNSFVIPATINGKTVSTTTTGAFKNNTTLTFVKIEDGVQGLGALAFLGCSSLSKVVIPESVTTIGANAFYNCASDFTIYCFRDSYAMQYAIDNSLNYVVMDIGETDSCTIDYDNELIFVSVDGLTSIEDILYIPTNSMAFAEASLISGAKEFLGTGSTVTVFDGNDISSEYTLIVEGDTNGDSVVDALDAAQVALVSNGQKTIDGAYKMAADNNLDDEISIEDYQAIVNKVVAQVAKTLNINLYGFSVYKILQY